VLVRSEIKGKGEPIQLDYRVEKVADGWKIYDVNVLGVWLVESYRASFAQEISASGIDGLIAKLTEKNKGRGRQGAEPTAMAAMRLPERITLREARGVLERWVPNCPRSRAGRRRSRSMPVRWRSSIERARVLVGLHRRAAAAGRSCRLIGMPPRLAELARLYGVSELVTLGTQAPRSAWRAGSS